VASNWTSNDPGTAELPITIGRAVEGLLASLPPRAADALRLAAIPHWFDEKLLELLGGTELDVAQAMLYLRRFRFVRQDVQGRFRYHENVRDYLLTWWREEEADRYQAANRTALAHFRALAEAAIVAERPIYEQEALYHLLIVDEAAGLQNLCALFEDALGRYQLGQAEGVAAQAVELEDVLSDQGRMWTQYFEARLDLAYRRNDDGQAVFRALVEQELDPILQAVARWSLGKTHLERQDWSQAIRLYRASLRRLEQNRIWMYSALVMLALGDAYRDLADSSGGFQAEDDEPSGAVNWLLYTLQHLPFLVYEGLVRRVSFLPNWLFGTNYQNWIIAYLLIEAARWYRQAEGQFEKIGDAQGLAQARLLLGNLEHHLGRWSRAQRRYARLLEADEIRGSLYRTAQVRLGQGQAFLDEGALDKAEPALSEAVETFRRFQDEGTIGVAAALLGRLYATLGQVDKAIAAYAESAQAFEATGNHLARTQIVWALENLAQHSKLLDEQQQKVEAMVAQVAERYYITRFPDALLRWFRRVALWGALPLTYVLTFVLGLALTLTVWIMEGLIVSSLAGTPGPKTVLDALILMTFATMPVFLALWLYRLIYTLMGTAVVHLLGRHLIPIEREQPRCYVTNTTHLTRHDAGRSSSDTVAWSDVALFASVDYYQRQRPIHLISSMILVTRSKMTVALDAITAGYGRFRQDIVRRLDDRLGEHKRQSLDLAFFDTRWLLVSIAISFAFALYLVYTDRVAFTAIVGPAREEVRMPLSSLMLSFVPTMLLVFPVVTLWRLVHHRRMILRTLRYETEAIPSWLLWLAAVLCTLIAALWILFLITVELSAG
jgi:tetratricopeptide (TPR) repeat protein